MYLCVYVPGLVHGPVEVSLHEAEEGLGGEQGVAARLVHGPDALDLQGVRQRVQPPVHALHRRHHELQGGREREKDSGLVRLI